MFRISLQRMIGGLLLQWLVEPDRAPTAADIAASLHALAVRA
jgi:hypothetical protein